MNYPPYDRMTPVLVLLAVAAAASTAEASRSNHGTPRLMQGPMLGAIGPNEILIWTRASGRFPVTVRYGTDPALEDAAVSEPVHADPDNDFVVVIRLEGLEPATTYYYRVQVNRRNDAYGRSPIESFRTAPAPGARERFRMAFGSCARVQTDAVQKIWKAAAELKPDFFVWVGDNIYGDSLEAAILAEEYRRQFNVASLQPFLRTVPQLAVWDDHDYGLNDHDRTNPIKADALRVFKTYWANPAYGLPETPGCFFAWTYGGVDFFFLDIRYYRDPNHEPDTPEKTMLGADQLAWLKAGLSGSSAPFKVLVSGSGWTVAKGAGGDSWASFLHERDRLFDYIRDEQVTGVVLVSGDTHCGELNAIPWSQRGGYDFYDLVSSPLAQRGSTNWKRRTPEVRLRPGFSRPNVGVIDFDLTDQPSLTFNLYGENGKAAWNPLKLTADDLRNGVTSYERHVEFSNED